ncbi:MAG: hypothetical protein HC819_12190 [Cyclobacteriaceae bacterium]|nr:hypothetical protein [Cyclobacteriaceae bacterium]
MNRLRTADESQSTPVVPDNQKSEFVMMEARGLSDFAAKRAAPLISTVRQLVEIEFMFNIFIPPKS